MKLRMINVGFGDCFLLLDENRSLLIDWGSRGFSKTKYPSIKYLVKDIKESLFDNKCKNEALITHFHTDHYSGFKQLAKIDSNTFDGTYIPYLYIKQNGRVILLELAIYFYTFLQPTSYAAIISANILNHLKLLSGLTKNNQIKCVFTGKTINFSGLILDVIWPDKQFELCGPGLTTFLGRLEGEAEDIGEFQELKREILDNLKAWYELTSGEEVNEDHANTIIERQNELIRRLDEFKNTSTANPFNNVDLNGAKSAYARMFSRSNDSASVVFQSAEKGLLMTADIEKEIIDNYLKDRFYENYEIMKVPHHGTGNHYSSNLPKSQIFLISSGERKNYGKVGAVYKYHPDIAGIRRCTACNTWCEILNSNSKCQAHSCSNNEVDILL